MAMPTTEQHPSNVQMRPGPGSPGSDARGVGPGKESYAPGDLVPPPGWAGGQDVTKPFLPEDFDKVLLMRCYPNANSTEELRSIAYETGAKVLEMAANNHSAQEIETMPEDDPARPPQPGQPPPPPPGQQPPPPPKPEEHDKDKDKHK